MAPRHQEATKAEFQLLQALWRLRQGTVAEVRSVCRELTGAEPAYTTVMTLLGRLEAKQLVKVDKTRQPFVYRPRQSQQAAVKSRLRQFLDTVFEGRAADLVLQLVEDEALTPEDLRRLEAKLAAREAAGKGGRP